MEDEKTIEEMHEEISEAEAAIVEANRAKEKAKQKLQAALNKCGATLKEPAKVKPLKPPRLRAKISYSQLIGFVVIGGLSIVSLVFSVVSPLSAPSSISAPMLVLIVLLVGGACSVIFLTIAASMTALYLSLRQPQQASAEYPFGPYQWLAQQQAGVSLDEDPKIPSSQGEEDAELARYLKNMENGTLPNDEGVVFPNFPRTRF